MEGKKKENENIALIAFAEKEKDVKKAQYDAEVKREQATAAQAGPLAEQEAKKKVVETTVEVDNIKTKKETEVAIAKAEKREKELLSEVVKPAEAQKQAAIAKAEGEKLAAIATAEGEKQKKELEGKGEAAAILAKGEAEAKVIELKLLAEAKGVLQKAEAYKQLNEAGKLLQILEAAKEIIPMGLEKLAPVMGEIAKPLGNVDRISIVDIGGDGNTGGGLGKFAKIAPTVLFQFFEGLKALGLDPSDLQKLIKVKPAADTGSDKEKPPEVHE